MYIVLQNGNKYNHHLFVIKINVSDVISFRHKYTHKFRELFNEKQIIFVIC